MSEQPILALTRRDDPNRFAGVLAEMLRMEGLNWFRLRDLDAEPLRPGETLPPLIVAGTVDVGPADAEQLAAYVRGSGALLAARPSAVLAGVLGLSPPCRLWPELAGGYTLLDPDSPLVADLPWAASGVQYRSVAHAYLPQGDVLADAHVAAWLAPYPNQRTRFPALLAGQLGAGRVAVFAFDPAASAVRQQQGNPDQASTGTLPDSDGDGAFRSTDLFTGELDPALRDVPQADLQRTLLLRAIEWLTEEAPLPRAWRFPNSAPAMGFIDGDSDSMLLEEFRLAISTCDRWSVPYATYLRPKDIDAIEPAEQRALGERGHRFGPHPWAGPKPSVDEFREVLETDCAHFASRFGYRPRIHRGHWVIWTGWVDHAQSLSSAGIHLDANFTAGRGFQGGYVNGTGLPAYFVDGAGQVLDIFEQSTISTDDGWFTGKNGYPAHTLATATTRAYAQIDSAIDSYHTVYHPYFHPGLLPGGKSLPYPTLPWLQAILAHGARRQLPFIDAERWLDWNVARRTVRLAGLSYDSSSAASGRSLTCSIVAEHAIEDVTILLPLPRGATAVTATLDRDGIVPEETATVLRHGRRYAAATLSLRANDARHIQFRWAG